MTNLSPVCPSIIARVPQLNAMCPAPAHGKSRIAPPPMSKV